MIPFDGQNGWSHSLQSVCFSPKDNLTEGENPHM